MHEPAKDEDVLQLAKVENIGAVPSATPIDHELTQGGKLDFEATAESFFAIEHATELDEPATVGIAQLHKDLGRRSHSI